jgi:multidrug efflux pump subunit AcrA (membrane-fusion protein)
MGDRARATIKVRVEILDADERLFPEMSSTVYFLPDESESQQKTAERRLFCPTDAIVSGPEGKSHVWLLEGDGRLRQAEVRAGDDNDGHTEILGGLEGGERVVVRPPADLREGQLVKVVE